MCKTSDDCYGLQPHLIFMGPTVVFVKRDSMAIDLSTSPLATGFERALQVPDKRSGNAMFDDELFNQRMANDIVLELFQSRNLILYRCWALDLRQSRGHLRSAHIRDGAS